MCKQIICFHNVIIEDNEDDSIKVETIIQISLKLNINVYRVNEV